MSNRVQNTTRLAEENPLSACFAFGMPGGIEASEARGQQQLLASQVLPTRLIRDCDSDYLALGFTFGEPVPGDEMFRAATLPPGWKREGSENTMWSYILGERGLRRVSVFYKAAFYGRAAHMSISNVGYAIGDDALYGDEWPTADTMRLSILSAAERTEVRGALDTMRQNIKDCPDIYGRYAEKLAAANAALDATTEGAEA